jgi:arabinofuranan 3-O-arabinosyltransferase
LAKTAERREIHSRDSALFFGAGSGATIVREFIEGPRWAKLLWVATLVIGLLDVIRWHHGDGFGVDTFNVWRSAHAILHGGAVWTDFVYLPGCLLMVFPLAVFPFAVMKYLVYTVQILGLAYTFWAMTRMVKLPLGSARVAWAALLLVLCGQVGIAAHYENFTLLLVPLAAAFFLAIDRDRPMAAAVLLGLSLTLKPLLAPLLLVLLLGRRWRETATALLIPIVLSGITLLIVIGVNAEPSQLWHEVTNTFSANTGRPWNMSLYAMARYLHAPNAVGDLVRAIVIVVCLITCWRQWRRLQDGGGEQAVWLTAPLFVIVILCFSFSWGYYCLLLLPVGFVSLQQSRIADWVVRVGVFVALAPPILVYSIPGYPERYYQEATNQIFGLGTLLNGASVIGVLVTLAGCLLNTFGDQLPATFQAELGSGKAPPAAPHDVLM